MKKRKQTTTPPASQSSETATRAPYEVVVTKPAQRDLRRLHPDYQKAFDKIILGLAAQPRPYNAEKMEAEQGRDQYRIRVRDFRMLYDVVDDKVLILVLHISPRGEVYKPGRRAK